MSNPYVDELAELASRLKDAAQTGEADEVAEPLRLLGDAAVVVGGAWSGSPLGYHSRVYYADFAEPPPGAHFSSEWGFSEAFSNPTLGEWREYRYGDVTAVVRERAGSPDLATARSVSALARELLAAAKAQIDSVLSAFGNDRTDDLVAELKGRAEKVIAGTQQQYADATLPSGQFMSRDMRAMTDGLRVAPHFSVHAEALSLAAPFDACEKLGDLAQQAGAHINRLSSGRHASAPGQGSAVFIGHGHSPLWRELKDFVQDRLGLPWEEFNRVPVAGVTNVARLAEMLDTAGVAFLLLTAEDEQADGSATARQNVVHEAGLFQGRLGFTRAIIFLEEGCAEFSNIQGLGQIRFPAGRISVTFEEARRVLEREGLLPNG